MWCRYWNRGSRNVYANVSAMELVTTIVGLLKPNNAPKDCSKPTVSELQQRDINV